MTQQIRKAHGSVDDTGDRPGAHVGRCPLTAGILPETRARECSCTCALFRDSYRRGGLARQIVIYVLLTADLSVLPFESRMTVHSDSLRSLERMTLSRMPWPSRRPGTRAQSRAMRRDPEWQILAWRPGLLSPLAPSTP